jgi:hypothetical protein
MRLLGKKQKLELRKSPRTRDIIPYQGKKKSSPPLNSRLRSATGLKECILPCGSPLETSLFLP